MFILGEDMDNTTVLQNGYCEHNILILQNGYCEHNIGEVGA